jgi:hypothetical protein
MTEFARPCLLHELNCLRYDRIVAALHYPAGLPNLTVLTTDGRKVLDLNTAIRHKCPTS